MSCAGRSAWTRRAGVWAASSGKGGQDFATVRWNSWRRHGRAGGCHPHGRARCSAGCAPAADGPGDRYRRESTANCARPPRPRSAWLASGGSGAGRVHHDAALRWWRRPGVRTGRDGPGQNARRRVRQLGGAAGQPPHYGRRPQQMVVTVEPATTRTSVACSCSRPTGSPPRNRKSAWRLMPGMRRRRHRPESVHLPAHGARPPEGALRKSGCRTAAGNLSPG